MVVQNNLDIGETRKGVLLEPFIHQVGGHMSMMKYDDYTVCKPLVSQERWFYESLPTAVKQFTPHYKGVISVHLKKDSMGNLSLIACPQTDNHNSLDNTSKECSVAIWQKLKQTNTSKKDHTFVKWNHSPLTNVIESSCHGNALLQTDLQCHQDVSSLMEDANGNREENNSFNPWGLHCHKQHLNRMSSKWEPGSMVMMHQRRRKNAKLGNVNRAHQPPLESASVACRGGCKDLTITEAYFVPRLSTNLMSVPTPNSKGYNVIFEANGTCEVKLGDQVYVTGFKKDGVYQVNCKQSPPDVSLACQQQQQQKEDNSATIWHRCFAHRDFDAIYKMKSENMVYQADTVQYICKDKYYGRTLSPDGFKQALCQFLHNGNRFRTDLVEPVLFQLNTLLSVIKNQNSYRFFSSSLLINYEGLDKTMPSDSDPRGHCQNRGCSASHGNSHPKVDVRMIDFAHTTYKDSRYEGPDNGYIFGLENLIKIIQSIPMGE